MFKVEFFCDDPKLPRILHALQGLILGQPAVQPVVNAQHKNGKITATTSGTMLEMFAQYLNKHRVTGPLSVAHVREFLGSHGFSENSATYLLQQAVSAGIVRRRGKGAATTYMVKP